MLAVSKHTWCKQASITVPVYHSQRKAYLFFPIHMLSLYFSILACGVPKSKKKIKPEN